MALTRAGTAMLFALLFSIYSVVYDGPELLKIALAVIGLAYWIAAVTYQIIDFKKET